MRRTRLPVWVSPSSRLAETTFWGILLAAVAFAEWGATRQAWVCDDAFISYRYAQNLTQGLGLVFNADERVEGYSNFLWTLWCALGLYCGACCEDWSVAWGVIFYMSSVVLLGYHSLQTSRSHFPGMIVIPVAAVLAAFHEDWRTYATSGLETSAFTFVSLLAFVVLAARPHVSLRRAAAAGAILAVSALTRPDGVAFVVAGALLVLWMGRPRLWSVAAYALGFLLLWVPHLLWRVWYYGDFLPNTYYAKSAATAWWNQGWHYAALYFQKYAVLLFGVVGLAWMFLQRPQNPADRTWLRDIRRHAVWAFLFGGLYLLCVVRVGGDFMYARMLIPATPFLLILIELGLLHTFRAQPTLRMVTAGLLLAGLALMPSPKLTGRTARGVVDERRYYSAKPLWNEIRDYRSATIRRYFDGLPVTLAFLGSEAHLVYRTGVPVAIESEAGLTDRLIARQTLPARGRIGHEKHATMEYLLNRGAHFTFHPSAPRLLNIAEAIPIWPIEMDTIPGFVLYWDPPLMKEMRSRGAVFADLPTTIDRIIAELDGLSDAQVAEIFSKLRAFYFDHVNDREREDVFRRRLGLPARGNEK